MPGSFTFKPIEANLTHDTELIGKMSPYCKFQLGKYEASSQVCNRGGKHPKWEDSITMSAPINLIPTDKKEPCLLVQVMDKDSFTSDDVIGTTAIKLEDIESGCVSKWYPIYYNDKPAGELLIESTFNDEVIIPTEQTGFKEDTVISQTGFAPEIAEKKTYIEQQQVIEPRTFTKEVDVVETVPIKQNIEVMEPVKVTKDVEYTEVVPVTKTIETIEPQVVKKEVEVLEPTLVTKTIQVVENVPVMKEVDVIENKTVMKEVETFEPQTFTKQVEVTDYVPVTKQVEVTEPVHSKKTVEFVEPVITTKTITKEIPETVVINQEIKTEVGPASLIHEDKIKLEKDLKKKILEKDIVREDDVL